MRPLARFYVLLRLIPNRSSTSNILTLGSIPAHIIDLTYKLNDPEAKSTRQWRRYPGPMTH